MNKKLRIISTVLAFSLSNSPISEAIDLKKIVKWLAIPLFAVTTYKNAMSEGEANLSDDISKDLKSNSDQNQNLAFDISNSKKGYHKDQEAQKSLSDLRISKNDSLFINSRKHKQRYSSSDSDSKSSELPEVPKTPHPSRRTSSELQISKSDRLGYIKSLQFTDTRNREFNVKLTNEFVVDNDISRHTVLISSILPEKFFYAIEPFIIEENVAKAWADLLFGSDVLVSKVELLCNMSNMMNIEGKWPSPFFTIRTRQFDKLNSVISGLKSVCDKDGNRYFKLPIASDGRGIWIRINFV